jgi:hypothetical protein
MLPYIQATCRNVAYKTIYKLVQVRFCVKYNGKELGALVLVMLATTVNYEATSQTVNYRKCYQQLSIILSFRKLHIATS